MNFFCLRLNEFPALSACYGTCYGTYFWAYGTCYGTYFFSGLTVPVIVPISRLSGLMGPVTVLVMVPISGLMVPVTVLLFGNSVLDSVLATSKCSEERLARRSATPPSISQKRSEGATLLRRSPPLEHQPSSRY